MMPVFERRAPPAPSGTPTASVVARWRRRLQGTSVARGVLAGLGVGCFAALLARIALSLSDGATAFAVVAALSAAAIVVWRDSTLALSVPRTALWLEEQEPSLRFSMVSAADEGVDAAVRGALERTVHSVPWERSARRALWRSMRRPALVALAGGAAVAVAPAASRLAGRVAVATSRRGGAGDGSSLGDVTLTVLPPRYLGRGGVRLVNPSIVRAYPGSRVAVEGIGAAAATRATIDSTALGVTVRTDGADGWRAEFRSGSLRALVRLERTVRLERRSADVRLIALEPMVDSAPEVTLRMPARDTVLRIARGSIPLVADVRDDLGLGRASFEYIVSSGEGERFTFKSGSLGALDAGATTRGALRATLSLDGLGLVAGDVVHVRAVARDRNDVAGPGTGTSESRTIRIARAGEYDSVAVDQAPPAEADSSILSQRMLINLTEALVRRARSAARPVVVAESRRIGVDQARLRRQVSDIIFARFGNGDEGDDKHDETGGERAGATPLTPEQLLKAAEQATQISGNPIDFAHDETPVVAINRPLLEAFNAMWDASRALDGGEPVRAIPPMYAALAAIQRARAAERLYLRGAPARVVVDLARVRLQGREKGSPGERTPRQPLDPARALVLARYGRALELLARDPSSGIDSLIVLRLAVAERRPVAARALEVAIGELRTSRDATAALRRVRRALEDALVAGDALGAWGTVR